MAARRPSSLELLELAADLWLDARRRVPATCGVLLAVAPDGERLFVGSEVPDGRVPALTEAVRRAPRATTPDREPPALAGCRELLAACRPLAVRASLYFLVEPPLPRTAPVTIVRSDTDHAELRRLNPGNWEPDEWEDLLAGALGPWAMALVDARVVSLCHTPAAMTARAAECGVWTHPDYRGRGYAGAVTAAWASLLQPSGRALFYSTDAGNRASQRVAARLGLRPLGRFWRLARADHGPRDSRHPLSRSAAAPGPAQPRRCLGREPPAGVP